MTLTAPTDGRIIRRDGEVGQFLPVNQPLFWMSCLSPLRIAADVDEEDIALVKPGQKVLVRADAFPGRIFNAHVQEITPKGDPIARSYRVRITLDAATPLQIGMTTETNIITYEKSRALLVPASAITSNTVWIVRDGHVRLQAVVKGIAGKTDIEITRGVSPSDQIVAKPDPSLTDGASVNAVQADVSK
jgi:RND family efflux transporter MFP subunit